MNTEFSALVLFTACVSVVGAICGIVATIHEWRSHRNFQRELAERRAARIVTSPTGAIHRAAAWSAIDDATYDGDGPIGYGPTAEAARANLLEQLEERA